MEAVDVVVVGGGAMGSAAAWQMARRGVDVVLLERFEPGHVRGSSHGSSRIVRLSYVDPLYVDLAASAYEQWDELQDDCGETLLTWTGVVDHGDPATVSALTAAILDRGHTAKLLDPREATVRWPGLRFDGSVLFHPRGGQAHADRTIDAMKTTAAKHGADVRHGVAVDAIRPVADGVEVHAAGETWRARTVVVAAGAWTEALIGHLVSLPRLTVTREQPAHFAALDPSTPWPSFIHHRTGAFARGGATPRGAYGLHSPDGLKVGLHAVGPIVDPEADRRSVDGRRLRELQDYVAEWVPGADPEQPTATPCLYTLTDNADFVIDRVGPVVVAAGFSGHGFKFTPEVGRILADLALGTGAAPARFGSAGWSAA